MPIRICNADTPELLDGVYKVRHKVFSEEEGKFEATDDGRVIDRFDAYQTSHCMAVVNNEEVVGSMRITLDSPLGLPADEFFDFRSHLPADSKLFSCGMYCVQKDFRAPRIALGLIMMASYLSMSNGVSHVAAPINPAIAKLLKRVGFKQLGDEFKDPHFGLPVLPMLLDINDLNDHFINFVKQNDLYNFLHSYEYYTFSKDEHVIKSGEPGDMAYVIIEGEVEIKNNSALLGSLKEGDIFGELALLTEDVRSADVFAKTDVKAMTLHKDAFLKHLHTNPDQAMKLINTLGQRIKSLNEKVI
ncbi:MAG: cyclic nucleotide-binding domain-containing protein [Gammaproteobacteria bacterium]|nr:cyclic nucleotide-binding domain-containing protein [Gammaproteobacteria bacterium]MCW8922841.1 cyclic nucleotide-binding domain-containing protein [Gammaproteobacteria bacterium]